MKTEVIKLSEFIVLLQDSKDKKPKVKNYNKIVFMIDQLTIQLAEKGDVNIPLKELQKHLI